MKGDRSFDALGLTRRELMKIVASAGVAAAVSADGPTAQASSAAPLEVVYDEHVIFDNSPSDDGYDASSSTLVPPSMLETVNGLFPVDLSHFVSPPNGLRLKWKSATGGDWRMTLRVRRRRSRPRLITGNVLTFWCFSDAELSAANSPLIYLLDSAENRTPSVRLVEGDQRIAAGQWVPVKLPFASFATALFNATDATAHVPSSRPRASGRKPRGSRIAYISSRASSSSE